jgi:hypothetical protein
MGYWNQEVHTRALCWVGGMGGGMVGGVGGIVCGLGGGMPWLLPPAVD